MPKIQKSYEIFDKNLHFLRWLADFGGCDIMVENYRLNYRTCFTIFNVVMFTVGIVNNVIFHYPDWAKLMETSVCFAFLLQSVVKFHNCYIHRHFFMLMYGRIRDLHYKHRNHPTNAPLLQLMARIYFATKVMYVMYVAAGFSYMLYPIYTYWISRERVLMIPVRFPFIDSDTLIGYIISNVIQLLVSIICTFGMTAADSVFLLFVCSLVGYVEVFKYDLNELSKLLQTQCRNEEVIREKVREICLQHLAIIEYESDLDERYFATCFCQIVSATIGLSLSLFLLYVYSYMPGYGTLLIMGCQLLEYCLLGTVLTVKNEEITDAIYKTQWYLMKQPEQKCFALMLLKSQNFVEMTVGGLAPLNIETFVSISKSIYSYFMMLINFVE